MLTVLGYIVLGISLTVAPRRRHLRADNRRVFALRVGRIERGRVAVGVVEHGAMTAKQRCPTA